MSTLIDGVYSIGWAIEDICSRNSLTTHYNTHSLRLKQEEWVILEELAPLLGVCTVMFYLSCTTNYLCRLSMMFPLRCRAQGSPLLAPSFHTLTTSQMWLMTSRTTNQSTLPFDLLPSEASPFSINVIPRPTNPMCTELPWVCYIHSCIWSNIANPIMKLWTLDTSCTIYKTKNGSVNGLMKSRILCATSTTNSIPM